MAQVFWQWVTRGVLLCGIDDACINLAMHLVVAL